MTTRDALVDAYLEQVRRAARRLPRARRDELGSQLDEHLREALPPDAGEAAARNELDRLGDPEQIVAEEYDRLGAAGPPSGGVFDWMAVVLLLVGGLVLPVIGWVVGVVMLWSSRVWSWREKLAGTLVVPGGLGSVFLLGLLAARGSQSCTGCSGPGCTTPVRCVGPAGPSPLAIALIVVMVLAPIGMSIYLGRRIRRPALRKS